MQDGIDETPRPVAPPRRLHPVRQAFYIAFIAFAAVFVYALLFKGMMFFRVPSQSMEPTLAPGDFIVTLPQQAYRRGDIVVLKDPLHKDEFIVKRIAAVGGDIVEAGLGYLTINGKYASEPYLREPISYVLDAITVPGGEVLVLGDNRNESDDASRWLIDPDTGKAIDAPDAYSDYVNGKRWKRTVPETEIVGKVAYRYLPFARVGDIMSYPLTNSAGD
ncbi:MAG: signal peptidase I [Candidatus Hydrogenedentes bacterium]|nr:signal peptidase I [Candidatus Hydrogenedentota bacterium]